MGRNPRDTSLTVALKECTEAVRELIAILRPPGGPDDLPAGPIGMAIFQARLRRGWSVTHLSRLVGVSRSSVVAWESGRMIPSQNRIAQLCALMPEIREALKDGHS